jgi:16S rRNA (uracil1498-N3)-methyltransferase
MHIFYTPDIKGADYTLNEEESKHCIRVLRLKAGAIVLLVDGKGDAYSSEVITEDPKK